MRRTKIVCTIGPASASDRVLEGLIRAGMVVARLNFSHGDHNFHRGLIRKIRHLERQLRHQIAILQDLPGPKIRIGPVAGDRVRLQNRRPFTLTTKQIAGSELAVSVSFPGLTKAVKRGDPILLGDGEIELEAVEVGKDEVRCRVVVGGMLGLIPVAEALGLFVLAGVLGFAALSYFAALRAASKRGMRSKLLPDSVHRELQKSRSQAIDKVRNRFRKATPPRPIDPTSEEGR